MKGYLRRRTAFAQLLRHLTNSGREKVFYIACTLAVLLPLSCAGITGRTQAISTLPGNGLPIGDSHQTIQVGDLERTYFLHIPNSYDGAEPVALVLAFHGGFGTGQRMAKLTGFSELADRESFVVVYPDGLGRRWRDGRTPDPAKEQEVDDIAFISALIDYLVGYLNIDSDRVYATGISNGGIFSHLLACELSDKITAIAPVAGTIAENVIDLCKPGLPVSVIAFHGTEDAFVPFEGGEIRGRARGTVISFDRTAEFWVENNVCSEPPQVTYLPDTAPQDGTRVERKTYDSCRDGSAVDLYSIEGGGHTWPGGPQYLPDFLMGRTCQDIHATQVIWDFFVKHRRQQTYLASAEK